MNRKLILLVPALFVLAAFGCSKPDAPDTQAGAKMEATKGKAVDSAAPQMNPNAGNIDAIAGSKTK